MGEKKKHKDKDKKKDKKKDKEEKKKKKEKYSSDSDDSDDSDSDSDSSSKPKKDKKQKKIKKDKKSKKDSPPKKDPPSTNVPYDFANVVPTTYPATIPGIKGMTIPVIPPPMPTLPSAASVPKPKSKEPNIFKLLPKLPYGAVLFAKTIYSGEYLGEALLDKLVLQMARSIEQTTKDEQHKKGMANIAKCINELEKVITEQREEQAKQEFAEVPREKNNRYELLENVYKESLRNA